MDTTVKAPDGAGSDAAAEAPAGLQPFLHDAQITVCAPGFAVSRSDGRIGSGADGFYHGDRRILSRLETSVVGVETAPISGETAGAGRAAFRSVLRGVAEHSPDPAVTLERRRTLADGRMTESFTLANAGRSGAHIRLRLHAATDLGTMDAVKSGRTGTLATAAAGDDGLTWSDGRLTVRLGASPAPDAVTAPSDGPAELAWDVELAAGESWEATVAVTADDRDDAAFHAAPEQVRTAMWQDARLRSADRGLDHWFETSRRDLAALLLTDPQDGRDAFLAAGAPWFLTLFGRDSLWAARMLLPLGPDLAGGTLRTLARRQGGVVDPDTEEQPGKILHEVRRDGLNQGELALPPCYYGTVDATPLWITLLHDAWRWGMPADQVEALLPHAEAAAEWMDRHGDADGDGFLEYVDTTGRGLSNQGWKDSGDAVRHRDGRLADAPIALCEVQAYAHEAAVNTAALLRAFGRPGADRWEEWADRLARRFRAHFWAEDADGPYPVIALDRDKQQVDAVTSNIGHLLGTGLLDAEESAHVAARLGGPHLDSGFGLRTLAADSVGFNPLGYHTGSIWPHDTAVAVHGLVRAGQHRAAASLAEGLIAASAAFDGRLPELFAGHGTAGGPRPAPYPASCRPQAWAAASSVLVLQSILGLEADAPGNRLIVDPAMSSAYWPLRAEGLRLAGRDFRVAVDGDGAPRVEGLGAEAGETAVEVRLPGAR
ncbi:amylo-alpha-1,6-glucosidase [Streptomyces meridianus]|uniref:Amylo-alpha-1,6-glucosidase n=1 Tax=Streptomyces meridianus TaxID=2938945 RepID=A0ABT0XDY5_9ACTN|nr:glycogen debranching N-terminal domain-containing protein [Streptomyces meridianus]MCM2580009.1 amylo-alpha-1,6-glucosidase [Streptomyces meridianus]